MEFLIIKPYFRKNLAASCFEITLCKSSNYKCTHIYIMLPHIEFCNFIMIYVAVMCCSVSVFCLAFAPPQLIVAKHQRLNIYIVVVSEMWINS